MESIYPKLALCGNENEWARTDKESIESTESKKSKEIKESKESTESK